MDPAGQRPKSVEERQTPPPQVRQMGLLMDSTYLLRVTPLAGLLDAGAVAEDEISADYRIMSDSDRIIFHLAFDGCYSQMFRVCSCNWRIVLIGRSMSQSTK
jgi:hypothetical protein